MSYQPNQIDQFFHRYNYDSDNRITIAETSKDGVIWEKDAKYFYYEHGPLARTEIGEKKVQAVDYAYTIQGWLKTVNGEKIDHNSMMGQDGKVASLNSQNARDAFGFSLSYFDNDYTSFSSDVIHDLSYGVANPNTSLYNGNIRTMYTALVDLDEQALGTHQTDYGYDQLNRIKSMEGTFHLTGGSIIPSGYSSNYSFDENGNLQTLQRTIPGTSTPFLMDNFTYDYTSGNNQLENVNDAVTTTTTMGLGDIQDGQDDVFATGGPNYQYDDIGQLLKDKQEKIVSIDWKVTNKVEQINFDMDGDLAIDKTIHFDYDPMGNRIAKHVTENAVTTSSFYTLDAQGNVMSIYGFTFIDGESSLLLKERNLYGSSRLGLEEVNIAMPFRTLTQTVELEDYYLAQNYTGDKRYELANHLGNVLEVITDRKLPSEHPTDPGTTEYYTSDVISFNDYYPYGMLLPYTCQEVPVSDPNGTEMLIEQPVQYTALQGTQVNAEGNLELSPSAMTWWTNGANSVQTVEPGEYIVLEIGPGSIYEYVQFVGLSYAETGAHWNTIDYAWYFYDSGSSSTWRDGALLQVIYPVRQVGDEYSIHREGGNIVYKKNGVVKRTEVDTNPSLPMIVDISMCNGSDRGLTAPFPYEVYNLRVGKLGLYSLQEVCYGNAQEGDYRYGFQGQEKDDEVKGEGNSINYKYRMHDPRVGRFFAVDPLASKYPWYTPYQFSGNKVIAFRELEGLEEFFAADGTYLGKTGTSSEVRILTSDKITKEYAIEGIKNYNAGHVDANQWAKNIERDTKIFDASTHSTAITGVFKHYFIKIGGDVSLLDGEGNRWPHTGRALASTGVGKENNLPEGKGLIRINYFNVGDGIPDQGPWYEDKEVIQNANDIQNALVHEYNHLKKWLGILSKDPKFNYNATHDENDYKIYHDFEKQATLAQVKHSTWNGTSKTFKQHMWDTYGKNYVTTDADKKKYFGNFGIDTEKK